MAKRLLQNAAVNFHFTRKCNFHCNFCFHTAKSSHILSSSDQKKIISSLREHGAEKINFAGGEPFLYPTILGDLVAHSKDIGFSSVSIISNGSLIKEEWLKRHGKHLDILGMSADTLQMETNFAHGRWVRDAPESSRTSRRQLEHMRTVAQWCHESGIKFKINTVVTRLNALEILSPFINDVQPMRWKIFQVLPIEGENIGERSQSQNVAPLLVSDTLFQAFVRRNREALDDTLRANNVMVVEDNETMQSSYILIDEYGRFLNSSAGKKTPTQSILEVGLDAAAAQLLDGAGFDREGFYSRDGYYPDRWSRPRGPGHT